VPTQKKEAISDEIARKDYDARSHTGDSSPGMVVQEAVEKGDPRLDTAVEASRTNTPEAE